MPDPTTGKGFNRYLYADGNPLKYNDPTGHTIGTAIHDSNAGPPELLSYDTFFHIQAAYYHLAVAYTDLPSDVRQTLELYKQTYGSTEAGYVDMGSGATSQTGTIRDPAVIGAATVGIGRLALRLPGLLLGACADGDCSNEAESASHIVQSPRVSEAYQIAKAGGKHAGFLRNYMGRSVDQIRKGISSIEQLIAEHRDKIANPEKYIANFRDLDPRQQEALLAKKWPADIQRQTEQVEILKGLLDERLNR